MKTVIKIMLSVTISTTVGVNSASAQVLPSCGCRSPSTIGEYQNQRQNPRTVQAVAPSQSQNVVMGDDGQLYTVVIPDNNSQMNRRLAALANGRYMQSPIVNAGFNEQGTANNALQVQSQYQPSEYNNTLRPRVLWSAGCQTSTNAITSLGAFLSNAILGVNCDASLRLQNY